MTVVQIVFLGGLSIVIFTIAVFGMIVLIGASRSGQGAFINARLVQRMLRGSEERAEIDRWAFYAHRVSGFAIFAFLCLHVLDVSLYAASARLYSQVHDIYGDSFMRVLECGLLIAILFHTFNGLRVLTLDVADLNASLSRAILAASVVGTAVLGIAGGVIILKPVI